LTLEQRGQIAIAARCLSAGYQGVPVVRDLDLEVRAGEMALLCGPNGAGKTTTMGALSGALEPLGGDVDLFGHRTVSPIHERTRKGVGVITEKRSVFNSLTTFENLRLGQGSPEDALEHFPELRSRLEVKAGLLSGGEQQMLSLARVLAARPTVLLVDELSFGLAPVIVTRLLLALRAAADDGAAVLLVEQHVQMCLKLVDQVAFMRQGSIVAAGSASEFTSWQAADLAELYL
jgi:branched-chain amino acid transport system ATP-binding protein